jgi:hypothetical protein
MLRRSLPLLTLLLLATVKAQAIEPALVVTPRAQPLPASATNHPFLAAARALLPVNLAARGYVESEFAVAGGAGIHEWAGVGAQPQTAQLPYTTRILVRQPLNAARFSGRVIVELLDASPGYDTAPLWGLSWEYFTRHGDAWVGVTVRPATAAALRRFDGVRYGSMSLGVSSGACSNAAAPEAESGLAWDVIAQVGALLRSSSKENPLLLFNPRRIIAAGYGQGGGYVLTYANAVHAAQRLGDGAPIYDGFLSAARVGAVPINSCAAELPANDARGGVLPRDVPFIDVLTESDAPGALPRDDNDAADDVFRRYEIAGAARAGLDGASQPAAADLTIAGVQPPAEGLCREPRSNLSAATAFSAIWQQYDDLLLQKMPMNREPRLATEAGAELRDEVGNARGGWRLPALDVPLATYRGSSTPRSDDARSRLLCSGTGSAQPLTTAGLKSRYGSRAEYLRRFNAAVDEAQKQRRLLTEDAAALKLQLQRTAPAF